MDKQIQKKNTTDDENYNIYPSVEIPWDIYLDRKLLNNNNTNIVKFYLINIGRNIILWGNYDKKTKKTEIKGPCTTKTLIKTIKTIEEDKYKYFWSIDKKRFGNDLIDVTEYRISKIAIYTLMFYYDLKYENKINIKPPKNPIQITKESLLCVIYIMQNINKEFKLKFEEINFKNKILIDELYKKDHLLLDEFVDYFDKPIKNDINFNSLNNFILNNLYKHVIDDSIWDIISVKLIDIRNFENDYLIDDELSKDKLNKKELDIIDIIKLKLNNKTFNRYEYLPREGCDKLSFTSNCKRSNIITERLNSIDERIKIWEKIYVDLRNNKGDIVDLNKKYWKNNEDLEYLESVVIGNTEKEFWDKNDVIEIIFLRYKELKLLKSLKKRNIKECKKTTWN